MKESDQPDAKSPTKFDSCDVTYLGKNLSGLVRFIVSLSDSQYVIILCTGKFKDGKKFDGGTTSFSPAQVIKGWTEAMQYMVEGDKWKLHIPYDLAYGERGSPPRIPGYTPLVFDIEIHKVKSTGGKPKEKAREMFQDNLVQGDEL